MGALINTNKTKSIRNLGSLDIEYLKSKVLTLSAQVWQIETEERANDFNCFHSTQHILFRFPPDLGDRTKVTDYPIWNVWKPILWPVLQEAIKPYGYKNGAVRSVMLAKLLAGSTIDSHIDGSESYYFLHKIHIPLVTNPDVEFYINSQSHYLEEGHAYEVNNIVPHNVLNKGKTDRIHLIFEYFDECPK